MPARPKWSIPVRIAVIAVDLGSTTCRAARFAADGASPTATASGPGIAGLAAPNGPTAAAAAVLAVLARLPVPAADGAEALVVAATGALTAPAAADELAQRLAVALPGVAVTVTSDVVAAHAGAFAGGPAVVLVAGTGSVAVGIGADGTLRRAGGWGAWLGDEGSGAWIGAAGLRAALQAHDGRGPATPLTAAAEARFGPLDQLPATVAVDNPARVTATFAPDVAAAADDGDPAATAILAAAADALAAAARAASAALPDAATAPAATPNADGAPRGDGVALLGGLRGLGEGLLGPLRAALAPLALVEPVGDALAGARRLAREPGVHASALHVRHAGSGRRAPAHTQSALVDGGSDRAAPAATRRLDTLATEGVRPGLEDLDTWDAGRIVAELVGAERETQAALDAAVPALAAAAQTVADGLRAGGRLVYVGAGTPGRLGALDAAECVPTFGVEPGVVTALLAGGPEAMTRAIEGAEDDTAAAARDVADHGVAAPDVVVGITSSGRTPYVGAALRAAREAGAATIAIANVPGAEVATVADRSVALLTGAEVLAGSTRLKAGTSQKVALNVLSTTAMILLGKVYGPRMVDLRATNAKLRRRALRIVAEATGADEPAAAAALAAADGSAKTAIVALAAGVDTAAARARLDAAAGHVRAALDDDRTGRRDQARGHGAHDRTGGPA